MQLKSETTFIAKRTKVQSLSGRNLYRIILPICIVSILLPTEEIFEL